MVQGVEIRDQESLLFCCDVPPHHLPTSPSSGCATTAWPGPPRGLEPSQDSFLAHSKDAKFVAAGLRQKDVACASYRASNEQPA